MALSQISALPIQKFIPSAFDHASSNRSKFIEVHYSPDVSEQMKQLMMVLGQHGKHIFRFYITFGEVPIPINIQVGGKGAFFDASKVKAGEYTVNGVSMKIIAAPPKVKRKRGRKKKSQTTNKTTANTTATTSTSNDSPLSLSDSISSVSGLKLNSSSNSSGVSSGISSGNSSGIGSGGSVNVSGNSSGHSSETNSENNSVNNSPGSGMNSPCSPPDAPQQQQQEQLPAASTAFWSSVTESVPVGNIGNPRNNLDLVVSFEPSAVMKGDDDRVEVTFVSPEHVSNTLTMGSVTVLLLEGTGNPRTRWLDTSRLLVGDYSGAAGGTLSVFSLEDDDFLVLRPNFHVDGADDSGGGSAQVPLTPSKPSIMQVQFNYGE
jgi:hypothetical protein